LVLAETTRADKSGDLPNILLLVEARLARELRCEEMSATATVTLTSYTGALPADFLGVRSVYDSDGPYQQVGLMEYRSNDNERVYAIEAGQLLARADSLDLSYFAKPAAMASDSDTTAILDAHPDVYLALMAFYVFKQTQDLELAQAALTTYTDGRDTLNELADRQRGAPRLGKPYSFAGASSY